VAQYGRGFCSDDHATFAILKGQRAVPATVDISESFAEFLVARRASWGRAGANQARDRFETHAAISDEVRRARYTMALRRQRFDRVIGFRIR